MRELFASGGNYQIFVEDGIVDVVVWRRPDVKLAEGAGFAREKVAHLKALAARAEAAALILDLGDAPPVVGPQTQAAVTEMLRTFTAGGRRIAVVVGPSATQQMQVERLVREQLGLEGCVFRSAHEARAFLGR